MARPKSSTPTAGELEILQAVWNLGTCTVREIHEQLNRKRPVAPTTVSSMVQIMDDKGLLKLIDEKRPQRYRAASAPSATKDWMIKDLVRRLFEGSPKRLVLHLLASKKATKEQLEQAEKLFNALD